ncbi:MAG: YdcF family protein, partial [Bdellovibrionales bacterium]|nr:YdcF family protein [Bdellovibrionales bacterium]
MILSEKGFTSFLKITFLWSLFGFSQGLAQETSMHNKRFNIPEKLQKLYESMDSKSAFVEAKEYAFAPGDQARDFERNIDIEKENKKVSQWLSYLNDKAPSAMREMVLVPGFVPEDGRPVRLHKYAKIRLDKAMDVFKKLIYPAIMVSGGNVHPPGTPYNEALEMKRYLMLEYQVPDYMIAIEPYAKNTVTNLRNV